MKWYKKWHDYKFSHHVHSATAVVAIFALIFSLFIFPQNTKASLVQSIKTITSEADFNQGAYSNTEATNTSGGEVQLESINGWWNTIWTRRKEINITNSNATILTDFKLKFTITYDSDMQADFDDLRFTNLAGTELGYWTETKTNSVTANVWVKIDSLAASTDTKIYVYYGNNSVSTTSNKTIISPIVTSGGTTTTSGSAVIHKFTSTGTFTVSGGSGTVEALVVAGGGGGGGRMGGGGGAGGLLYNASFPVSSQNYTITVGAGGAGGYAAAQGLNGSNSTFSTLAAVGGGGGGFYYTVIGQNGGSGGGGGGSNSGTKAGGTGISDQGYSGGAGRYNPYTAGGGGGASAAGADGSTTRGGVGGAGKQYSISGVSTYYAGGGGGAGYYGSSCIGGLGGIGGGGAGNCASNGAGVAGTANTGGGGGGAGYSSGRGGTGGSGIVIIRYDFRSIATVEPTSVFGSEVASIKSSGTWQTTTDIENGAIDLIWNGGWGTPNGLEADVTIPANSLINFEIRSSVVGGASDSNWSTWQNIGSANPGTTTYMVTNGNMPGNADLPIGTNRYVQLRANLSSSDGVGNPQLKEIRLIYMADNNAPTNPNLVEGFKNSSKTDTVSDENWSNSNTPYFGWSGETDGPGESGVDGYWVYFGTDPTADPMTAGAWQVTNTYQSNIEDIQSGKTYYLCISTQDEALNRYINGDPNYFKVFTYKFDKSLPQNPSNVSVDPFGWATVNEFDFNWNTGSDPMSNGDASGIAGYQYRVGDTGDWSVTVIDTSLNNIIAYKNGENNFYLRTVDKAGNISEPPAQIVYRYNADAPEKPTYLTVNPQTSQENNFTFEWDLPNSYNGSIKKYYYSVNALPSENNSVQISVNNPPSNVTINGGGHVILDSITAASQQGLNTFYVVAMDDTENINFNNYEQIQFECNTPAPGPPTSIKIFDTSDREEQEYSIALSWKEPTFTGVGFSGYIIERSDDNSQFNVIGAGSSPSFIDTELESRTYYYRVLSKDNSGNVSAPSTIVSIVPTGKYTTPPELTDGPTIEYKISSAKVSWLTDREASSFVEIGENTNYGLTQGQFDFLKKHEVNLDNLKPDTIYHYRVKYVDQDGNIGYSADSTFKTEPAPRAANVEIFDIRLTTAVVTWNTTAPAECSVLIGKNSNYSTTIENVSGGFTKSHSVRLSDLEHSSLYHFAIRIKDIDDNEVISDDYSFETLKFPKVSLVRLEPIKDASTATMKFTWTTNVPTTSVIEYTPQGGRTQEAVSSKLITSHELIIPGLQDNTPYVVRILGRDQFGNQPISDRQTFKTDFDTRPPKVKSVTSEAEIIGYGLEAKGQLVVYWETDEPSTSQVEFGIGSNSSSYTNKTQEDSNYVTSHVVIVSDLKTSAPYHIRTASRDQSGNVGYSEDRSTLVGQASNSVFDIIVETLNATLGWLFRLQ